MSGRSPADDEIKETLDVRYAEGAIGLSGNGTKQLYLDLPGSPAEKLGIEPIDFSKVGN